MHVELLVLIFYSSPHLESQRWTHRSSTERTYLVH